MTTIALSPHTISAQSQSHEDTFRAAITHLRHLPHPREPLLRHLLHLLPEPSLRFNPTLRAQRDALQSAILAHPTSHPGLLDVAARAMDAFLSVRIHGARAKTSAFFDSLCRDRSWTHIAILSPSTVASACFQAINDRRKRLTIIDVAPHFPGRVDATSLASQTGAPVRYCVLANAHKGLDGVDVLVIGAREVCMNGCVVSAFGAGVLMHVARELGIPVVVATQSVKFSHRVLVDWCAEGDVIRPTEISAIVTEMDTASWNPALAPEVLRKLPTA